MAREGLPSAGSFLRTESGSAGVLALAIVAAVRWANAGSSYATVWVTHVSVLVGEHGVTLTLREWVSSGLMAVLLMVVGLETRREFDLGELRDRRRLECSVPRRSHSRPAVWTHPPADAAPRAHPADRAVRAHADRAATRPPAAAKRRRVNSTET
jgi:hypothetical protein